VFTFDMDMINYFVCRKYDNSKPKYVNAPWPKGDTLFIAEPQKKIKVLAPPIIVEGIFDAIAVARIGYRGIAVLGKSITSPQLSRLANVDPEFIIYLDNDALSHAVQLKMQLDALGSRTYLIRQEKDAADLYNGDPSYLKGAIENARKH
jgi:DNA primase